jgi:hypothetical protein
MDTLGFVPHGEHSTVGICCMSQLQKAATNAASAPAAWVTLTGSRELQNRGSAREWLCSLCRFCVCSSSSYVLSLNLPVGFTA